jgi:hypothetical protein
MMQFALEQHQGMTKEAACKLLKQRGYGMVCPIQHVHATDGYQQWHICRLDELHAMEASQFLECLDEALKFRIE